MGDEPILPCSLNSGPVEGWIKVFKIVIPDLTLACIPTQGDRAGSCSYCGTESTSWDFTGENIVLFDLFGF